MIDDVNYAVRKLVRTVMAMPENSVRPAKQHAPAGGQVDEMATVEIISDDLVGTPGISYETTGTVPSDVTTERVDQVHRCVASVNFYRRPPTSAYLRGFAVSDDPDDYIAILDGAFDIVIDGTNRQVTGIDLSGATTMLGIAAIIQTRLQAELAATRCAWDASLLRFVITSPTTTQTSAVSGAVTSTVDLDPDPPPTDVSAILGLTTAGGALPVNNRAGIARYGNAAVDRAARLPHKLWGSAAVALMNRYGLAFLGASPVRNLTALEDGTWESRGQVDLTFSVVSRETAAVETILTVPLTTNSQAPGADVRTTTTEVTS
jgi:hypothetical protein